MSVPNRNSEIIRELARFFQALADARRSVSTVKARIAHSDDFSLGSLFQQMDPMAKGVIELGDLYQYLAKVGIHPSEGEIFSIFKELDIKKKGFLTPSDLSDYFSENPSTVPSRHSNHSKSLQGKDDTVKRLFIQLIDNHLRLEEIKVRMSKGGQAKDLFKILDISHGGVLTLEDIRSFLKNEGLSQQSIVDVFYWFSERGVIVINFELFSSLIEPYDKEAKSESRIPQELPSYPTPSYPKTHIPLLKERASVDLQSFLKEKSIENKARREYIESHEKARNQLMDQVLAKKNNYVTPPSGLKKSSSTPYVTELLQNERQPYQRQQPSSSLLRFNNLERSVIHSSIRESLDPRTKGFERQVKAEEFSFNHSYLNQGLNHDNISNIIRKQQEDLEQERARRMRLEDEMNEYKKQLILLGHKREHSPEIRKPLEGLHPTLELINMGGKGGPVFRDYIRPSSAYKKPRQSGKIQHRGVHSKEYSYVSGSRERMQDQLRRSRLEREFTKFRLQKELGHTRQLWR